MFIEKFNSKVKQERDMFYLTSSTESGRAYLCDTRWIWITGERTKVPVYNLPMATGRLCYREVGHTLEGPTEGNSKATKFVII